MSAGAGGVGGIDLNITIGEFALQGPQTILSAGRRHDACALSGEEAGRLTTDSAGGPDDENYLILYSDGHKIQCSHFAETPSEQAVSNS